MIFLLENSIIRAKLLKEIVRIKKLSHSRIICNVIVFFILKSVRTLMIFISGFSIKIQYAISSGIYHKVVLQKIHLNPILPFLMQLRPTYANKTDFTPVIAF